MHALSGVTVLHPHDLWDGEDVQRDHAYGGEPQLRHQESPEWGAGVVFKFCGTSGDAVQ